MTDDPKPFLPKSLANLGDNRLIRWLLPPALAAGAVGVHFSLNVPDKIVHSRRDQGAGPAPRKAKNPLKRSQTVFKPRSSVELDRLWAEYGSKPFASEPVDSGWARKFQAHINKAVVVARSQAFDGAPEQPQVVLISAQCKTIRCRFVLRGVLAHEVDLLVDALKNLQLGAGPLWRDLQTKRVPPPSASAPKDQTYMQFTVAFIADEIDPAEIQASEPER